jgi:hypothetical protein
VRDAATVVARWSWGGVGRFESLGKGVLMRGFNQKTKQELSVFFTATTALKKLASSGPTWLHCCTLDGKICEYDDVHLVHDETYIPK